MKIIITFCQITSIDLKTEDTAMISKEIRETTDGYSTRYDVFDTSSKKKAVIKTVKYQIYSYKKRWKHIFLIVRQ